MDLATHALMGAYAAHLAPLGQPDRRSAAILSPRERLLLGGAAAVFPDLDFIGFAVNPLRYLAQWHQGPTHSLLLLPLWALLLGGLFCTLLRRRPAWWQAVAISAVGLASHLLLDVITAYGTQLWYPLSATRVSLGLVFVIDPLFTGLIVAGLWVSVRSSGRRGLGGAGMLLLCAYVGLLGAMKQQALRLFADTAGAAPSAADKLDALPQPFSPFNWKLIAVQGSSYRVAHVNLVGHRALLPAWPGLARLAAAAQAYQAPAQAAWQSRQRFGDEPHHQALAQPLWLRPEFTDFRRFAVYPALSSVADVAGSRCVWFTDLRYDLPALPDTFRYGFCQDSPTAPWQLFRLRYFSDNARHRIEPE